MIGETLTIEDLRVQYGGVRAVDGISLAVEPGTCTALLGANGAGKTSTLRGIGGLESASGSVRLGDARLDRLSPSRRARSGLAHVLEGRHVFSTLTVGENLRLAARGRESAAVDPLELLPELVPMLERPAGALSGGQQQMVAIARAVAGAPRAIMLDEPTNGLAPLLVARTTEIIGRLRDVGFAVLLVEQRLEVAQQLDADVLVLKHGEVIRSMAGSDPGLPDVLNAAYLS